MDACKVYVRHEPASSAARSPAADRLVLPFERRQKTRQRVRLESGEEAALMLPRGTVLRGGDRVLTADGLAAEVAAAAEEVSSVTARAPRELARAAYHLGNRHVPVEVGEGLLRYLRDHVLDAMVRGLGLAVVHEVAPFEPEAGAYAHGHSHGHAYAHAHSHAHGHVHPLAEDGRRAHEGPHDDGHRADGGTSAHPHLPHHAPVPFRR